MTMVGVMPTKAGTAKGNLPLGHPGAGRGSREPPCGLVPGRPPGIPAYAGMTRGSG